MADDPTSSALSALFPGFTQLQQLIHETKVAVAALETLISTPAAAAATGSPPASVAIVALGVELAVFIAETVQAMEHDIDTLAKTAKNYQVTEANVVNAATTVLGALNGSSTPSRPTTGTTDRVQRLTTAGAQR